MAWTKQGALKRYIQQKTVLQTHNPLVFLCDRKIPTLGEGQDAQLDLPTPPQRKLNNSNKVSGVKSGPGSYQLLGHLQRGFWLWKNTKFTPVPFPQASKRRETGERESLHLHLLDP